MAGRKPKGNPEERPIETLIPYARNARTHSDAQIAQIAASIREFGWTNPVLVDGANGIIAGHGRVLAARKLGLTTAPCIELSHLSETQRRAYIIADNKLALNAAWDEELLRIELDELQALDFNVSLAGFDAGELAALLADKTEGLTDPDEVPEAPVDPVTVLGDVWVLGKHRLMCGDSTAIDAVERLMGGEKADLVFTDPPYGVNYTGGAKKRTPLANDHAGTGIYSDALPLLNVAAADHAALYLWYADAHAAAAAAAAAAAGYVITAQIIWVKNNAQFVSSARYHSKHEPCFYAYRKGMSAAWYGENNEVTVWEVDRANKNEYHPTQKPVALAKRAIGNSSKHGDVVLDMFGGSGSTLIASEETGRRARLMEIAPQYVDVAVRRWQNFTGQKATLDGDGRSFDEMVARCKTNGRPQA